MKKLTMGKYLIALVVSLFGTRAIAQIDPMFNLYRFNNILVNPADAGQQLNPEFSLQGRSQWVGVAGNPRTMAATFSMPINGYSGLAGSVIYDQVGPATSFSANFDYSYKIELTRSLKVVTALRVSGQNQTVGFSDMVLIDRIDEAFDQNLNSGFLGNGGVGLRIIYKNHSVGVSQPRLMKYTYLGNYNSEAHLNRGSVFCSYSGKIKMNEDWHFTPQVLSRIAADIPVSLDVTAAVNYKKALDLGFVYRLNSAIGIMAGVRTEGGIQFGYVYEYPTNAMNNFSVMTHEFSVKYGLNDMFKKEIINPRNVQ